MISEDARYLVRGQDDEGKSTAEGLIAGLLAVLDPRNEVYRAMNIHQLQREAKRYLAERDIDPETCVSISTITTVHPPQPKYFVITFGGGAFRLWCETNKIDPSDRSKACRISHVEQLKGLCVDPENIFFMPGWDTGKDNQERLAFSEAMKAIVARWEHKQYDPD